MTKWVFSGSKAAHSLDGATSASGSITTLRTWLKDSAINPNTVYESGDVDVFADNTQRKGKTNRVKEDGVTPIGIATNVVFIQSNPPSNIQLKEEPFSHQHSKSDIISLIDEYEESLNCVYRHFRQHNQENLLKTITGEVSLQDQTPIAQVTLASDTADGYIICMKFCSFVKLSEYCTECGFASKTFPSRQLLYGSIPDCHPKELPSVKLRDIIGVNPNSYKTITEVLKNLVNQAEVGDKRVWIEVSFDRVPYRIANKIMTDTVKCSTCSLEFSINSAFEKHTADKHQKKASAEKVFGNVLLAVGAGHMEKNLLLAVFKLSKDTFLGRLADLLGFRSVKIKEFIFNCRDHHLDHHPKNYV